MHTKSVGNLFNGNIPEKFPNLENKIVKHKQQLEPQADMIKEKVFHDIL